MNLIMYAFIILLGSNLCQSRFLPPSNSPWSRCIFVRSHFVTASHSLDVINLARIFPPSERKTSEGCLQNVGKNTRALASFISKRWKNAALSVQSCRDCSRELMPTAFASISLCRPHTLEVTYIPVLVLF